MRPKCICGRGSAPNPAGGSLQRSTRLPIAGADGSHCPVPKNSFPLSAFGPQECTLPRQIPGCTYAAAKIPSWLISQRSVDVVRANEKVLRMPARYCVGILLSVRRSVEEKGRVTRRGRDGQIADSRDGSCMAFPTSRWSRIANSGCDLMTRTLGQSDHATRCGWSYQVRPA